MTSTHAPDQSVGHAGGNQADALPRTAFIGVGSMGGAILAGLTTPGVAVPRPVRVTTGSTASAEALAAETDPADVEVTATEQRADANRTTVQDAEVVILAVKPWLIHEVLQDIAGDLRPHAIVVSVAAGVTMASMEALLPAGVRVVRAMPNTPAHVGRGVTGVAAGVTADDSAVDQVRRIFETVGDVLVVGEDRIDEVSAVSGSGPAYVFLFAEALQAATERLGFSPEEARVLAQGTLTGAAELLARSGEDPAQLRRNVTSPNGTTERAIEVLQTGAWGALFDRAFEAAVGRAKELAAG